MTETAISLDEALVRGFLRVVVQDGRYLCALYRYQADAAEKLLRFFGKNEPAETPSELSQAFAALHAESGEDELFVEDRPSIGIAGFAEIVRREAERRDRFLQALDELRHVLSNARQRSYGLRLVHPGPNLGFGLGQPSIASRTSQAAYEYRTRLAKLVGDGSSDWLPVVNLTNDAVRTPSAALGERNDRHIFVSAPSVLLLSPRYRPELCGEVAHWFARKLLRNPPTQLRELVVRARTAIQPLQNSAPWFGRAVVHEVTVDTLSSLVAGPAYAWVWLARTVCIDPISDSEPRYVPHYVRARALRALVDGNPILARLFDVVIRRFDEALTVRRAHERISSLRQIGEQTESYARAIESVYHSAARDLSGNRDPRREFVSPTDPSREVRPDWLDDPRELDLALSRFGAKSSGDVDTIDLDSRHLPGTLSEHLWVRSVSHYANTARELNDGRATASITHVLKPQGRAALCLRWIKPRAPQALLAAPPNGWRHCVVLGDYNLLLWRDGWNAAEIVDGAPSRDYFSHRDLLLSVDDVEAFDFATGTTLVTELRISRAPTDYMPAEVACRKLKETLPAHASLYAGHGWGDAFVLTPVRTTQELELALGWIRNLEDESISRVVIGNPISDARVTAAVHTRIGVRVFARLEPGRKAQIESFLERLDPRCSAQWVAGHDDLEFDVPLLDDDLPAAFGLVNSTVDSMLRTGAIATFDCRIHLGSTRA